MQARPTTRTQGSGRSSHWVLIGLVLSPFVASRASGAGLTAEGLIVANYGGVPIFSQSAGVTNDSLNLFQERTLESGGDTPRIVTAAYGRQGGFAGALDPPTAAADVTLDYQNSTGQFPAGWIIGAGSVLDYSFTIASIPSAPSPINNITIKYNWSLDSSHAAPTVSVRITSTLLTMTGSELYHWVSSVNNDEPVFAFRGLGSEQEAAIRSKTPFEYSVGSSRYTIRTTADASIGGAGLGGFITGSAFIDPVIEIAPGFEQYYSIVYDEGVFVPEPNTMTLTALGLLALGFMRRRESFRH